MSLPTENTTVRMRAWRALKACGAAVLRDGVYFMPEHDDYHAILTSIAADVISNSGSAYILIAEARDHTNYLPFFDRSNDYAVFFLEVTKVRNTLSIDSLRDTLKQVRKFRKTLAALVATDFYPGAAKIQAEGMMQELEFACSRIAPPDESHPIEGDIACLSKANYQGRIWATRRRPWVDRLASAWLIRRFIDPTTQIIWLSSAKECPSNALGFDFDGAAFSHVGSRVTFEVLMSSFLLDQASLRRLGALVHYLDVGGVPSAEAAGVKSILTGLCSAIQDDDLLLEAACTVFDALLSAFQEDSAEFTALK